MFSKVNNHSPLLVKKNEAKDGSAWNQLAQERFHKQHGDVNSIPEGDLHAVHRNTYGPVQNAQPTEEQAKETLNSIEQQIKTLQDNEKNQPAPLPPKPYSPPVSDDFYDDWKNE